MLPVPSSSSMSSSRFCFNRECSQFNNLEHYRPGWRLRAGDFADLCDCCASAYEQGKFCEVFHQRASGWRCCESCGKRIHCGCIVSASAFMLLDAGGIECLTCARKKFASGPNFSPPSSSFLFQSPISEKFKDLSINWGTPTGSSQISYQPPSFLGSSLLQFGSYDYSQSTSKDRATTAMEKKRGMNGLIRKLMSENSKNCKVPRYPNVSVYKPLVSLKESPCGTQFAFPVSSTTPIDTTGHSRLDGSNLHHTPNSCPLSHLHNDLHGGAASPLESKSPNLRTHLDKPGKYQGVPRYLPKVSYKNQVLQNIFKEPDSVVAPLFEKMLSASDTGRVGRLVLPKKCAEKFLPQISQPEGVPLKVLDPTGKEWNFQFRFWPNSNSRMYFLEGVTPCIQSLQLQAGDTVIFSRLDPERKLIMGFRKASVPQPSDQETDSMNNNRDTCTNGDVEPVVMHSPSKVKNSANIAEETPGVKLSSGKKRSSMMVTRSKRQKVEKGDLTELKLTYEEAQIFILPPPNLTPSIVEIEDSEFEEYEDAPIIGKPTVYDTGVRATCSADQELIAEEHDVEEVEGIPMAPETTTKHPRHRIGCTCIVCVQSPSGKGPKHDRCCSCKVCEMVKRRKRSLLLNREKKHIEKEDNVVYKELEPLSSIVEALHQSADNSKNNEHHSSSPLKSQIDLNFQPEKDEEPVPGSNTTTKNKSLHHDVKPPSSSNACSQIVKEDEGELKTNTEVAEKTKSSS